MSFWSRSASQEQGMKKLNYFLWQDYSRLSILSPFFLIKRSQMCCSKITFPDACEIRNDHVTLF